MLGDLFFCIISVVVVFALIVGAIFGLAKLDQKLDTVRPSATVKVIFLDGTEQTISGVTTELSRAGTLWLNSKIGTKPEVSVKYRGNVKSIQITYDGEKKNEE